MTVGYNFSSMAGFDDMFDDEIIENILTDEWCNRFYAADAFKDDIMDFGGGVKGLHCRAILNRTENSADNLLSFLGLRKNQKNLADCMEIITLCENTMKQSAYLV